MHVGRPTRVPAATAALSAAGGRGRWDSHPTPGGDTRPSGHTSPLAQGPYGSPLGVSLLEQAARGGGLAALERPRGSSRHAGAPTVGEQLRRLIDRAVSDPRVVWRSVGEIVSESPVVA